MNLDQIKQEFPNGVLREAHPFYMYDAIQDIPGCLRACLAPELAEQVASFVKRLSPAQVFAVGCGTSLNSAKVCAYAYRALLGIPALAMDALDFAVEPPLGLNEKALVISFSHSGQTKPTLLAQVLAKQRGAVTMAVSSKVDTALGQAADFAIADPYADEIPYGKTRSYLSAALLGALTAVLKQPQDKAQAFYQAAGEMVAALEAGMPAWEQQAEKLAAQWSPAIDRYMLAGFGLNAVNAEELGLKLLEVLGESSIGFCLEEFIHGPGAGLWENTGVVLFQTDERVLAKTLEIAKGVAASRASLLVVTDRPEAGWPEKTAVIAVPQTPLSQFLTMYPVAVVAQLVLYRLAVQKRVVPDINCRDRNPELMCVSHFYGQAETK
ncbi:MAG TPA: SIS domain-containing protein [Anaerolineaceae bacterium]|nr:SIS domain-containing protein [Anaerolineaceae bacterium]